MDFRISKDVLKQHILPYSMPLKFNYMQASPEQELTLLRAFLARKENNHAFSLAALLADAKYPATLKTCTIVLSKNPNFTFDYRQWQKALYLAARDIQSMPLTQMVLHTCPTIKSTLKLIWLASKRLNIVLSKTVLLHYIAPRIIINATEAQLERIREIVSHRYVFKNGTSKLMDPDTIEQHRASITKELYATIGINKPAAVCSSQSIRAENRAGIKIVGPFGLYYQLLEDQALKNKATLPFAKI